MVGLMGQREKEVEREPPSLGRKGDVGLCLSSQLLWGTRTEGDHGTALCPSGPPFLGTPGSSPDAPCLPLHSPLGAAPMKLYEALPVFATLQHQSVHCHACRIASPRSHHEAFTQILPATRMSLSFLEGTCSQKVHQVRIS